MQLKFHVWVYETETEGTTGINTQVRKLSHLTENFSLA